MLGRRLLYRNGKPSSSRRRMCSRWWIEVVIWSWLFWCHLFMARIKMDQLTYVVGTYSLSWPIDMIYESAWPPESGHGHCIDNYTKFRDMKYLSHIAFLLKEDCIWQIFPSQGINGSYWPNYFAVPGQLIICSLIIFLKIDESDIISHHSVDLFFFIDQTLFM